MQEVRELEKELKAFQKIEAGTLQDTSFFLHSEGTYHISDIQTAQKNKQQLLTQKNENEMVKEVGFRSA